MSQDIYVETESYGLPLLNMVLKPESEMMRFLSISKCQVITLTADISWQ